MQGRTVDLEDLRMIRDWLQAHPDSNRTQLSRALCARWNWRNGVGRLKDMAARTLLLKLEAAGYIQLPPRRRGPVHGRRHRPLEPIEHDQSPLEGPLQHLLPIRVEPVGQRGPEARLFRFLLQRYHYLGHRNCVGENMKYLARERAGRPLACLLFGSAAWKVAARDRWLGWTGGPGPGRLGWITNNTRFLILPWVRVRHLASHLLGLVTARLSADWQHKYGHPIDLVESFVDPSHFAGSCYRAAGWVPVGLSTGRTRNDDGLKPRTHPKAIYVKVLRSQGPWRGRA